MDKFKNKHIYLVLQLKDDDYYRDSPNYLKDSSVKQLNKIAWGFIFAYKQVLVGEEIEHGGSTSFKDEHICISKSLLFSHFSNLFI